MEAPVLCDSFEIADAEGAGEVVVMDLSNGVRLVLDALGVSAIVPDEENGGLLSWDEIVVLLAKKVS